MKNVDYYKYKKCDENMGKDDLIEKNDEIIIYTTDGQADIEVRLEDENVWLTQMKKYFGEKYWIFMQQV